jgi:hypothetical protein
VLPRAALAPCSNGGGAAREVLHQAATTFQERVSEDGASRGPLSKGGGARSQVNARAGGDDSPCRRLRGAMQAAHRRDGLEDDPSSTEIAVPTQGIQRTTRSGCRQGCSTRQDGFFVVEKHRVPKRPGPGWLDGVGVPRRPVTGQDLSRRVQFRPQSDPVQSTGLICSYVLPSYQSGRPSLRSSDR